MQGKDFQGPRTYPLSSSTIRLDHAMDITSWASLKDHNFVAFVDATSLIGGRDAVEEFIASGLWPLR